MRTVTFYSYKGGTGRSLAVANTAHFLARSGFRVFVLDLDLEAPGLHYKFDLEAGAGRQQPLQGLVDLITKFAETGKLPPLNDFVTEVGVRGSAPRDGGRVFVMPAGSAPSAGYLQTLRNLDLPKFFNPTYRLGRQAEKGRWSEPHARSNVPVAVPMLLGLKARIETDYRPDYLLIDSRTGITELGGAAVLLLPDVVVCFFHNSPENLEGARKVLHSVKQALRPPRLGPIEIVAAMARIPEILPERAAEQLEDARRFLNEPSPESGESLSVPEVIPLRADPLLDSGERILFKEATANESVLLRDYYKLFRALRLDRESRLNFDDRDAVARMTDAEDAEGKRDLVLSARRLKDHVSLQRLPMKQRLRDRDGHNLKVVPIVYLSSSKFEGLIGQIQDRLMQPVAGPGGRPALEPDPMQAKYVDWDVLAVDLCDGRVDFCADLYYLSDNRSRLVEIVQLGRCSKFAAFAAESYVVHQQPETAWTDNLREWVRRLPKTDRAGLGVGVLGETPAASEANRLLSPILKANQLVSHGSELALLEWLKKPDEATSKIAICDIVVARRFEDLPEFKELSDGFNTVKTFDFERPIPIGIVYPREDWEWRREIARALAESLIDFFRNRQAKAETVWLELNEEFQVSSGIEVVPLDELHSSLLLDMPFDEALAWNARFKQALEHAAR